MSVSPRLARLAFNLKKLLRENASEQDLLIANQLISSFLNDSTIKLPRFNLDIKSNDLGNYLKSQSILQGMGFGPSFIPIGIELLEDIVKEGREIERYFESIMVLSIFQELIGKKKAMETKIAQNEAEIEQKRLDNVLKMINVVGNDDLFW